MRSVAFSSNESPEDSLAKDDLERVETPDDGFSALQAEPASDRGSALVVNASRG